MSMRRFQRALRGLGFAMLLGFIPSLASAQYPPSGPAHAPPPPAAYGGAPQTYVYVDPQRVAMLQMRLSELHQLRSQHGVGGPIAMMAIGGGTVVIAGFYAAGLALARAVSGTYDDVTGFDRTRALRVTGIVALVGAGLTIGGGFRLRQRLVLRRQYNPEILQIRQELRGMGVRAFHLEGGAGYVAGRLRFAF